MHETMQASGVDVTYEEGPGGHEWDFWNRHLERFVDWLPLEGEADCSFGGENLVVSFEKGGDAIISVEM